MAFVRAIYFDFASSFTGLQLTVVDQSTLISISPSMLEESVDVPVVQVQAPFTVTGLQQLLHEIPFVPIANMGIFEEVRDGNLIQVLVLLVNALHGFVCGCGVVLRI